MASAALAQAEQVTLELVDGTHYTEVEIQKVKPTEITFRHSEGMVRVPAGALTDESLSKLGLKPEDNPEFDAQRDEMALKANLATLKRSRPTIPMGIGTNKTIKTQDITEITPVNILVVENGVPRRIEIVTLPKDIQKDLGYDEAKALAYTNEKSAAELAAAQEAAKNQALQDKKHAELAKKRAEEEKKAAAAAAAAAKKSNSTKTDDRFNAIRQPK